MQTKFPTREQWLNAAVEKLRPYFERRNHGLPDKLRVTCGWPATGALRQKGRTLGQCWSPDASADQTTEVFISPFQDIVLTEWGVLSILCHELTHSAVGVEEKHGKAFKAAGKEIGLVGKPAHMVAGPDLLEMLGEMATELGEYPHAKLDQTKSPIKKQTTRMLKCVCGEKDCGFTVRLTHKWLHDVGLPHCPKHGEMVEVVPAKPKQEEGEDE